MLRMTARSRSTSWRVLRTTSSTRYSTSASTTSTIWLTARSTLSVSTCRWRTRRGRLSPLLPAATLVLASSRPSSTSSSSTGLPSSISRGRSSTRLDSSSRQVRARGYRHLRLVLHQLRQHRRLHGRQLVLLTAGSRTPSHILSLRPAGALRQLLPPEGAGGTAGAPSSAQGATSRQSEPRDGRVSGRGS